MRAGGLRDCDLLRILRERRRDTMETVLKVIGVLAIPVVWGVLSAWLIERLRERRHGGHRRDERA